jgi:hypothetical protein
MCYRNSLFGLLAKMKTDFSNGYMETCNKVQLTDKRRKAGTAKVNKDGIHVLLYTDRQTNQKTKQLTPRIWVPLEKTPVAQLLKNFPIFSISQDRFCGLVVKDPGYRSRGPEFDSRLYPSF